MVNWYTSEPRIGYLLCIFLKIKEQCNASSPPLWKEEKKIDTIYFKYKKAAALPARYRPTAPSLLVTAAKI